MSEWLKKKKEQVKRFLLKDRGLSIPDPIKTTKPVMDKLAGINTRPISSKAKTTVGKIAGGIVETPFTFLTSVPKFYGQTMNDITSGRIKTKQGQKKTAGLALETALDTASVGLFGKAKAFAKGAKPASQTLASLIRKSAKKGAKIGTGYGAGYGLSQGLQENRDTKSLISSTLKSGVIGGITGGGLGWGVPSGSALFKAGKHDLNVKLGKSYGKPKIVPGFERINGKLFYGRRIDPNAPQFKKTLKDVTSTIPRPGMSLETVKGKGRIPVSDIRKFSKQPKKTIGWKETQLNATVNDNLNPFFKEGQLSREIEAGKMKTAKLFKELFEAKKGGKLSAAEETRRVRELNEVIKRLAPRQAESGRALNIQKKKVNFDFEDKDLDQLVKENPKLKTVVDFIKKNKERDPDFIDKLIEYRTAGLLSGIKTVVRNVIGNTTATALKFPEKAVAGGLDAIYSKVTGKPRQIFAGEAVEDFKGIFSKNSAGKNFINALKNEDFSTMSRLGELPKMKAIKGKAGKIIRIPYRMANAPDEFFRTANIAGEKRAMAYREYKKKDLAGLFNKQPKKTADPLHKEARKYKSAEEFVKAQGTPVYRTEKADIAYKGKSVWGDGKYFGIDKNQVKEMTMSPHSGKSTGGKVDEYLIPSNLKIKEINIGWDAMKPKDFNNFPRGNDLKKQILNEGYDGVILKTDGDLNLGGDQLIMYKNADQIKTKSQLTDIWKKANQPSQPLQEARKWNVEKTETQGMNNNILYHKRYSTDLENGNRALIRYDAHTKKYYATLIDENNNQIPLSSSGKWNPAKENGFKTLDEAKSQFNQFQPLQEGVSPLIQEARKYKSAEEFADWGVIMKKDPVVNGKNIGKDFKELEPLVSYRKTSDFLKYGEYKFNEGVLKGRIGAGQELIQGKVNHWKERISKGERPIVIIEDKPYVSKITDNLQGGRQYDAILEARVRQGHSRLEAYRQLGIKEVPVVYKSQLTDIWNKAQEVKTITPKTKPSIEPLIEEAKKYKSAEEFVKAQGTPKILSEQFDGIKNITSKSSDVQEIFTHGSYGNKPNPRDIDIAIKLKGSINDSTKLIDEIKDFTRQYAPIKGKDGGFQNAMDITFIDNKGKAFVWDGIEIRPSKFVPIKTKSQLTDIWNKANTGGKPTFEEFLKNYSPRGE